MSNRASMQAAESAPFSIRSIIAPLMAIIIGMFMVILDSTAVNVAIPTLVKDFNTTLKMVQWTVTGYTLALSAVIPLAGWLSDRFGAKQVFLVTISLFTIGSVLCSFAQTPEQLIIYRIIQGLGGGMVAPLGMAMVFRLAPPDKRGAVMGSLGIPMLLAPALGPVLSGWLVEYASWHWIFLINLPIGIAGVIVGFKFLPKIERHETPKLDVLGMLLAPVAFAMLAFGVSEGGSQGWSTYNALLGMIVGGVALVFFIIVELLQRQPLLELRVFGSSDFTRGIILSWISQMALFGSIILLPLYLQQARGFTPLESGLIVLPQALAAGIGMPIGGRLFDKVGARPLALIGLTLISCALFFLTHVGPDTKLVFIMISLAFMGFGMGFTMMPLNTHVLNAAPRRLVSRVTPLTTAAQQVVVSFAVAGLTGYLATHIKNRIQSEGPHAMAYAYGDTFVLTMSLALVGIVLSLFLRRPKVSPESGPSKGDQPDPSMMVGH